MARLSRAGFRSTPPRGGRLTTGDKAGEPWPVSIHAPAWGATPSWAAPRPIGRSFDPRPRVGGDIARRQLRFAFVLFRSTPPRGGRHGACDALGCQGGVSIHAPAWGATLLSWSSGAPCSSFDPRPRVGGDCSVPAPTRAARTCFDPRPRVGGDPQHPRRVAPPRQFRSPPPRGGRPAAFRSTRYSSAFRSTPPRGGRRAAR